MQNRVQCRLTLPVCISQTQNSPAGSERWLLPLYWLAGARWETLREHPETERERIAVLGSSVLIPTTLAFFGMYFYASNRFETPRVLTCLLVSLVWAFIIMNTDRILLATYRPFQPWGRKLLQVIFRVVLGSVVSVAISLPFCLNQYRPAIKHRFQTEFQSLVSTLRAEERTKHREIDEQYRTERENKLRELRGLQKDPIDPASFADSKIAEEKKRVSEPDFVPPASAQTRDLLAQMDIHKESQAKTQQELKSEQDLHRRLVEAVAREKLGEPNEFYPLPKRPEKATALMTSLNGISRSRSTSHGSNARQRRTATRLPYSTKASPPSA